MAEQREGNTRDGKGKRYVLTKAVQQALAQGELEGGVLRSETSLRAAVRIWSDVLTHSSVGSLRSFVGSLEGSYTGGSYWCPATNEAPDWSGFFSVFAEILGITSAMGVEWWVRRARSAEGKDFHFDKDEQLFREQGRVQTPTRATVFYLSGTGGPTLVAAQTATPDGRLTPVVPTELAVVDSVANQLLEFPGNLSHAVLGCDEDGLRITLLMNWWHRRPTAVELTPRGISFPTVRKDRPQAVNPRTFVGEIFTTTD